ncbi:MAG TPA: RNA polymerase sigma factor [Bryobacteraceae bacterium]|nr:RNA polymerase sigma factor [Bryobacteraceae bacterium]
MLPLVETDDELLLRMRCGDEEAFVALYRRRHGSLYRFALHMTGAPSAAEDVTQEVFLALIRDDCGYDPERGSLSAYLFGIARKLVLRHLERSRTVFEQELEGEEIVHPALATQADPIVDLMRREGIEALRKAVFALPKRYREVVILCDLEEMDYSEAAGVLGCPIGTVRSRLHRARALLLEKLRQRNDPQPSVGGLKPARSLI